jgi:hypothetical protein
MSSINCPWPSAVVPEYIPGRGCRYLMELVEAYFSSIVTLSERLIIGKPQLYTSTTTTRHMICLSPGCPFNHSPIRLFPLSSVSAPSTVEHMPRMIQMCGRRNLSTFHMVGTRGLQISSNKVRNPRRPRYLCFPAGRGGRSIYPLVRRFCNN